MDGITTVTQKGQITIHKAVRDMFGLTKNSRVRIVGGDGFIKVTPVKDILDLAREWNMKAPKGKTALKARVWMEKHYTRV